MNRLDPGALRRHAFPRQFNRFVQPRPEEIVRAWLMGPIQQKSMEIIGRSSSQFSRDELVKAYAQFKARKRTQFEAAGGLQLRGGFTWMDGGAS